MYDSRERYEECKKQLISIYGEVLEETEPYDFNYTHYYDSEMGKGLKKIFLLFNKEISMKDLISIKYKITELEDEYSVDKGRRINIDPGTINNNGLWLATWKGKGFKEYIGNEVWAHKVLEFKNNKVFDFYHTFKDYKEKKELFLKLKEKFI